MSLAAKLKSVYTTGDQYTVLKLLKELIDTIDEYETETTKLYQHNIYIVNTTQRLHVIFTLLSNDSTAITKDNIEEVLLAKYPGDGSRLTCTGDIEDHAITYFFFDGTLNFYAYNAGSEELEVVLDPTTATISDTVVEIIGG